MEKVLTTSLSVPSTSFPELIIEQEGYGSTDGILSRPGLHRAIWALLNGEVPDEPECVYNCGTRLYVYRYDLTLDYELRVSYGELGEREVQGDLVFTQKIRCQMEEEKSLDYPNWGIVGWSWLGDKTWDKDGNEIPSPPFTAAIDHIRFNAPVYGTLALTYRINRDKYDLAIEAREDSEENKFSSIAYAIHRGGPTWIRVQPAPGVEETLQQCTGGGGGPVTINPPEDPDKPPTAPHADARIVYDYCTQEVLSDTSK